MALGVLAGAVAGVIEHGRRRRRAAERAVVADIGPQSAGDGLALGQDRHRGVIAMQALGRQHMGFDQAIERLQHAGAGPDLIGQGRQAHLDTLTGEAFALPVERLVLAELLEQDHGQQARSGPAPRDRMERCRWLGDLLAFPAGEFLPHRLDYLPLARNAFQGLGDGLAQLGQFGRSAAGARARGGNDDALTRQMSRERLARRSLAGERLDHRGLRRRLFGRQFILAGGGLKFLELELHLLQQPGLAFGALAVDLPTQLRDLQPE